MAGRRTKTEVHPILHTQPRIDHVPPLSVLEYALIRQPGFRKKTKADFSAFSPSRLKPPPNPTSLSFGPPKEALFSHPPSAHSLLSLSFCFTSPPVSPLCVALRIDDHLRLILHPHRIHSILSLLREGRRRVAPPEAFQIRLPTSRVRPIRTQRRGPCPRPETATQLEFLSYLLDLSHVLLRATSRQICFSFSKETRYRRNSISPGLLFAGDRSALLRFSRP